MAAAIALVALALRMLVPPGYMPGSSLAQPIVLCAGQGPMPGMAMDHGGHRMPGKAPHAGDHPCVFAGLGAPVLTGAPYLPPTAPAPIDPRPATLANRAAAPGRGMAAPPPPAHAPPARIA